jgi:hypothetical protein
MPRELAAELKGHEVRTVAQMGWKGLANGDLLAEASKKVDVLLTMDKAMPTEQDISRYRIAVILVRAMSNRMTCGRLCRRSCTHSPLRGLARCSASAFDAGRLRWRSRLSRPPHGAFGSDGARFTLVTAAPDT